MPLFPRIIRLVAPKRHHGATSFKSISNGDTNYMSGKPFQSCLNPYETEILSLRHQRPPMPYAKIAAILSQKHDINVCRQTISKFIRRRLRRRRFLGDRRIICSNKPTLNIPSTKILSPVSKGTEHPIFEYTPSDRYNLTRLTPEEAARRKKELEEEGDRCLP